MAAPARSLVVVLLGALALVAALPSPALAGAQVVIVPFDPPGTGYFDPTPATPVGGNPGTTVGEQRLIAAQFAATLWGATLTSDVPIFVGAQFTALTCTPTSAILGSAGATTVFANFAAGIEANTWYHGALADAIVGVDLDPGFIDIISNFNSNLNGNPACLGGRGWYYGLDHQEGTDIDFLSVLMHELGHGLGHANFVNESTGSNLAGLTDIYSVFTLDDVTGLHWSEMTTNAERAASAVNCRNVSWDGPAATAAAIDFLAPGTPLLAVHAPASVARGYAVGAAQFGPPVSSPGVSGELVLVDDGTALAAEGCNSLVNAADVAGKIALVHRGTCAFTVKAKNAQDAGAVGVVVVNNAPGCPPPGLGGVDPTVVVPTVMISQEDGNTLEAELPGVTATLGVDPARLAGANAAGNPLLFAVNPVAPGSSISHWESLMFPHTLMEPAINSTLAPSVDLDLSPGQMEDVGWTIMGTTMIEGCDTGIGLVPFLAGQIEICRLNAQNHGKFVSCVSHFGNELKKDGLISGAQKGQLTSCAAGSSLP